MIDDTEKKLIDIIGNISKRETEIENLRENINEMNEFEPFAVFTRIDRNKRRRIESKDLARFLNDNIQNITDNYDVHLNKFIEMYDLNNDNALTYDEYNFFLKRFLLFVITKQNHYLRSVKCQKLSYSVSKEEYLNEGLEKALTKLFVLELNLHKYISKSILDHKISHNSVINIFRRIDMNVDQRIDFEDISDYLQTRSYSLRDKEIISFISRYDFDNDLALNIEEFNKIFFNNFKEKEEKSILIEINTMHTTSKKSNTNTSKRPYKSSNIGNHKIREENSFEKTSKQISKDEISLDKYSKFQDFTTFNSRKYQCDYSNDRELFETKKINNHRPNNSYSRSLLNRKDDIKENTDKIIQNQNIEKTNKRAQLKINIFNENTDLSSSETSPKSNQLEFLMNLLHRQIEVDKTVENFKQRLTNNPEFNLISIFKYFDRNKVDYLDKVDLLSGLESLNLYPTENEINLLFNKLEIGNKQIIR